MESLQQLSERLIKEWGYVPSQSEAIANKILSMDKDILAAFDAWDATDTLPDNPVYFGYSPRSIAGVYPQMKYPAIFLLLDWIRREPDIAVAALEKEFG
jgi:hypothetical protein